MNGVATQPLKGEEFDRDGRKCVVRGEEFKMKEAFSVLCRFTF
jgi:hypothetical protein